MDHEMCLSTAETKIMMSSLRDGSGTSLSLHIISSITHRKVLRRIRISFLVQRCLSLILLLTAIQLQYTKAFLTPLSNSYSRNIRLRGRVIDDTVTILNHDPHPSLINTSKHKGNHDEEVNEQSSSTSCDENLASNGGTKSSLYENTANAHLNGLDSDPSTVLRSQNSSANITQSIQRHQQQPQTTQPIVKQPRPLSGLSRTHQSLLSKTSHMRRQRFVTGKYPLYVEVKQNPTKKWLGLAESRIYLNG